MKPVRQWKVRELLEGSDMREKTRVRRMFVLDGGSFQYETAMMVFGKVDGETHQRAFSPIYAFETEEGWILYDTGWPPEAIPMLVELGMDPKIGEENSAVEQLKKIGVAPSDVTKIIRRMSFPTPSTQTPSRPWPMPGRPLTTRISSGRSWTGTV